MSTRSRFAAMTRHLGAIALAAFAAGCATTYNLTLMPRDSGKLYHGVAEGAGGTEGTMSITIEGRTYTGTWVEVVADRASAHVTAGIGSRRSWATGGIVIFDNPGAGEAKALLRSPDGAGLRCDLRGGTGRTGGGVCRDDKGLEYDVQIRQAARQ